MQKSEGESGPFLTPHTETNAKRTTDLSVRAETAQLLQETTGINHHQKKKNR